jgi:hypothetical protein
MAGDDPISLDALAMLVVPLASPWPQPEPDYLCWHRWEEAYGQVCGLDSDQRSAHKESPFKRYPGSEWSYFNPHVERLLFPRHGDRGERWICCPDELWLCASWRRNDPQLWARIDLLERLTVPDRPDSAFGLLHLSLEPGEEEAPADRLLWWAWAIRSRFRPSPYEAPHFELRHRDAGTELTGKRPLRDLVERTLGAPHPDLERRLFTAIMATCPRECADLEAQSRWRRAMARRRPRFITETEDGSPSSRGKDEEQTAQLGRVSALVMGDGAFLTQADPLTRDDARNFRSYWSESLLTGVIQHESLEHFQGRLASIGSPVKPDIEPLYRAWLEFRNLIWWSQLSNSTSMPQELLFRLRAERGTERLFTDLEGDLATYSAQRRAIVEEQQARALGNLQVGGAGIVILSPLLAIVGLSGAHGRALAAAIAASLLIAAAVAALVYWRLILRHKPADTESPGDRLPVSQGRDSG